MKKKSTKKERKKWAEIFAIGEKETGREKEGERGSEREKESGTRTRIGSHEYPRIYFYELKIFR